MASAQPLAQLSPALGPVLSCDRGAEPAPRGKIEVQEKQYHQDADPLHKLDVEPDPCEPGV